MSRTFVVAEDHEAARVWAKEQNLGDQEWVYVTVPDLIRGIDNPKVVNLGWPSRWTPVMVNFFKSLQRQAIR